MGRPKSPNPKSREDIVRQSKEKCQHLPCTKCGAPQRKKNSSWCQSCVTEGNRVKWNSWSEQQKRDKWLRNKYKIRYPEYIEMFKAQGGKCKICSVEIALLKDNSRKTACVDHCHKTSKIRGLLCNHCNRALGLLKEDKQTIKNLLEYVCLHT